MICAISLPVRLVTSMDHVGTARPRYRGFESVELTRNQEHSAKDTTQLHAFANTQLGLALANYQEAVKQGTQFHRERLTHLLDGSHGLLEILADPSTTPIEHRGKILEGSQVILSHHDAKKLFNHLHYAASVFVTDIEQMNEGGDYPDIGSDMAEILTHAALLAGQLGEIDGFDRSIFSSGPSSYAEQLAHLATRLSPHNESEKISNNTSHPQAKLLETTIMFKDKQTLAKNETHDGDKYWLRALGFNSSAVSFILRHCDKKTLGKIAAAYRDSFPNRTKFNRLLKERGIIRNHNSITGPGQGSYDSIGATLDNNDIGPKDIIDYEPK